MRLWLCPCQPQNIYFTTVKTKNMNFRLSLQNGELLLQEHCSENYLKVTICKHFTKHTYCDVQVKMWLSILTLRETSPVSFRTLAKLHYEIRLMSHMSFSVLKLIYKNLIYAKKPIKQIKPNPPHTPFTTEIKGQE